MPTKCKGEIDGNPCKKSAGFGFPGGKQERCSTCRLPGMMCLKTKKCEGLLKDGSKCKKQPSFGYPGGKRVRCATCKLDGMVVLNKKICEGLKDDGSKCKKQSNFGYPGGNPERCATCKLDGMVNLTANICEGVLEDGSKCKKQPSFGYPGCKRVRCATCKLDDMVKLTVTKKCIGVIEGNPCDKQPSFGLPTDTTPTCCATCKTQDMIDIINKKCVCGTKPFFGLPTDITPSCCSRCKTEGMVNIVSKRCECGKQPSFGLPTDTTPTCCATCKTEGMINIVDKKCIGPLCETKANRKYRGYCAYCFSQTFPDDPIQPRNKTKELKVRAFLRENYSGFIHDMVLDTNGCDCTHRRRIDFRQLIGNTMLCIECDENQHNSYTDEEVRYNDVVSAWTGKWIFIRFNPDNYRINGELKKTPMKTRLEGLKNEIDKQISRIEKEENEELLEVVKLYFNRND